MNASKAVLAATIVNLFAAQAIEIKVLSGKPEMVSGAAALIEIGGASSGGLHVTLNGQDVTSAFRPGKSSGTLLGKVDGLKLGPNILEAVAGANKARLRLVNHAIGGPVFSGPHQQPFICQTEALHLGKAVDADCNAPARVEYLYKPTGSIKPANLTPLNASAALPTNIAMTTTTQGKPVRFIVRVETGTINRGVYRIAFLHEPGQPLPDPWTSAPGWNGRLVYSFGGGCRTGFRQGQTLGAIDMNTVGAGYALATSSLDVLGNNCNDVINAETLMMVKEYFIKTFGVPVHTIGFGGSGGAIQQYTIAQNYPGLLDGINPGMSFPDMPTVLEPILDCAVLARAFDTMSQPLSPEQQLEVSGYGSWGLCVSRNHASPEWVKASACDKSMPADKIYNASTNPHGTRCSLDDNQANVFGRDPKTGVVPQYFDNVGLQYGLRAFNEGKINADQFLDLNEHAGGFNRDGDLGTARSAGDARALKIAYETGRVNTAGGSLTSMPIIGYRRYGDTEGNPHDRVRSLQMRQRIERAAGSAANQVLIINPPRAFDAVRTMDQWLDRIEADTAPGTAQQKAARNKPAGLEDSCTGSNDEKIVGHRCDELYPPFTDPRIVAGEAPIGDVLKCSLKPVNARDYRQPLSATQLARLKKIFPQGVCDFSRPGVGQTKLSRTWISYDKPW
jgi:hypothetical protein